MFEKTKNTIVYIVVHGEENKKEEEKDKNIFCCF